MTVIAPSTLTVTPVNLLEIIEITGEAIALQLVKAFGGQTVRLPAIRNINEDHTAHEMMESLDPNYQSEIARSLMLECERIQMADQETR